MSEVKRYDISAFGGMSMDECSNGAYINYDDYVALEAKCAALAAELSQSKSVVSECREYFIAGIMNRMRPTNEGYLHMRCDTLGDETSATDAFLAEVRAQGVEMAISQALMDGIPVNRMQFISRMTDFAAQLRKGGEQK